MTYSIDSPVGQVSGSETLAPASFGYQPTWQYGGGLGGHDTTQDVATRYSATITLPNGGVYADTGLTFVNLDQSVINANVLPQNGIDLTDVFTSSNSAVTVIQAPPLTLSNLTATVSGATVNLSVDTSPAIVNVTLTEGGVKIAPDIAPVNGVASWTLSNLAPGTHTLAVQGWDSPSGQPGHHSAIQKAAVTVPPPPPPSPPPPPPGPAPQPVSTPAPTPSASTPPPASGGAAPPPVARMSPTRITLVLPGRLAIPRLLHAGGYRWTLRAPKAGGLLVTWRRGHTLIARGEARFREAGRIEVRIRLSTAGQRVLRARRSLQVATYAIYTASDGTHVSRRQMLRLVQ